MSDWTEWKGGKCPVADGERVVVQFRNGDENQTGALRADCWNWHWNEYRPDYSHDIVAYRVVTP